MRVLVAFDKFKHSLSATELCALTARTLRKIQPTWSVDLCPLTDGGDGFEEVLREAVRGDAHALMTTGPRGGLVESGLTTTTWARVPLAAKDLIPDEFAPAAEDRVALIELARSSGIARLAPDLRDPWQTSTHGTGQLIRAAAELGAQLIILGIGGSATNDLGLGALSALGFEFRSVTGGKLRPPTPHVWKDLAAIDGSVFAAVPPIIIACDVDNPLLGPRGAAATFGPQKGLPPNRLDELERQSARVAQMLCAHCGQSPSLVQMPGTGAAGGTAFGLLCATRARLVSGAEFVERWLRLPERIAEADIVITGEGHFDATSLGGKGPGHVLALARAGRKSIHVFAGKVSSQPMDGVQLHQITSTAGPADEAVLRATGKNLVEHLQVTFGSPR